MKFSGGHWHGHYESLMKPVESLDDLLKILLRAEVCEPMGGYVRQKSSLYTWKHSNRGILGWQPVSLNFIESGHHQAFLLRAVLQSFEKEKDALQEGESLVLMSVASFTCFCVSEISSKLSRNCMY